MLSIDDRKTILVHKFLGYDLLISEQNYEDYWGPFGEYFCL